MNSFQFILCNALLAMKLLLQYNDILNMWKGIVICMWLEFHRIHEKLAPIAKRIMCLNN